MLQNGQAYKTITTDKTEQQSWLVEKGNCASTGEYFVTSISMFLDSISVKNAQYALGLFDQSNANETHKLRTDVLCQCWTEEVEAPFFLRNKTIVVIEKHYNVTFSLTNLEQTICRLFLEPAIFN